MASGTRGKLKEQLEGIHKNCDWINQHCTKALELIPPGYPDLINGFHAIEKIAKQLDDFAQSMYGQV